MGSGASPVKVSEGPCLLPPSGSGAEVERGGHSPLPPPEDELRERDERGLDRDAERWYAEWGGNE